MKKRSKKILAVLLTAGLVASSSVTAWAEPTNNETTNSSTTEETGSKTTITAEPVEVSGTQSAPVIVDGDIVGHDAEYGVEIKDSSDSKASGTVTVNGNISVDDTNSPGHSYRDSTGKPWYSEVGGVKVDSKQGGNGTVTVTGDVDAASTQDCGENNQSISTGVHIDTNADVTIGGSITSTAINNSAGIDYSFSRSKVTDPSDYTSKTTVGGDVISSMTGDVGYAVGVRMQDRSTYETTVGGSVKVDGTTAYGIHISNPVSDTSSKGNTAKVTVGGNVEAEGTKAGIGIYVVDNLKDVDVTVDGDIKGSTYGIYVEDNMSDIKIKTDGTISSTEGAAIAVVAATEKTLEDGSTTAADGLPDITVWKIESGTGNLVAGLVTDDDTKTAALKNDVLSSINYIIKASATEDGKEAESSKIVLEGTKGTVTIGDKTYDTAHQGDKIVINVVKGYKLTSLSNGQALLTAEADGTYTVEIPAGGGVDLKAVLEKIVEQKKSSSSDDNDDSSSSAAVTSTTTVTSGGAEATSVSVEGVKILVEDPTFAADGSLTHGLVVTDNMTVAAATGEAKRAGLPEVVTATLDAIDAGNLAAVPVATGAMSVLAKTVAITKVAPNMQLQLVVAKNNIPTSGIVQILYYLNTTGQFILLPAIVDPATGIVTFTAPGDGTAAIIG